MICKHCGAEADSGEALCPHCGKDIETADPPIVTEDGGFERAPKAKSKLPVILISLSLVAAMVGGLFLGGILPPKGGVEQGITEPVGTANTTAAVTPPVIVGDEKPADAIAAHMEGYQLDNAYLGYFYWEEANSLISYYGDAGYFDPTAPFSGQEYPYEEFATWHDMLVANAVDMWAATAVLFDAAMAEGHVMNAEYQQYVANLVGELDAQALAAGAANATEYLIARYGRFAEPVGYAEYINMSCMVSSFVSAKYAELTAAHSGDEILTTDTINIRHILFTTGTDDDAAVKTEADRVYALFLENPTEDNFAALALEYTADGNGAQGGLYEGVYPGQMVPEFNDWCFDPGRVVGDNGIVQTSYGYHLMYFSGVGEPMSDTSAVDAAVSAEYGEWIGGYIDALDYTINSENVYPW